MTTQLRLTEEQRAAARRIDEHARGLAAGEGTISGGIAVALAEETRRRFHVPAPREHKGVHRQGDRITVIDEAGVVVEVRRVHKATGRMLTDSTNACWQNDGSGANELDVRGLRIRAWQQGDGEERQRAQKGAAK